MILVTSQSKYVIPSQSKYTLSNLSIFYLFLITKLNKLIDEIIILTSSQSKYTYMV